MSLFVSYQFADQRGAGFGSCVLDTPLEPATAADITALTQKIAGEHNPNTRVVVLWWRLLGGAS